MAMNRIQFQRGMSMPEFLKLFGTEDLCAAALESVRWPDGFRCQVCGGAAHCVLHSGGRKSFQCNACRHQTSLIGRSSENKVAFVAAVSMNDESHPFRIKLNTVSGFKLKAIADWASKNLAAGSTVYSDGLACFNAVTQAGCTHESTVVAGRKPKDVLELQWINTVLGNLKTSLSGAYHSFAFKKYAQQYLAAFVYRFNRRFDLKTLAQRLLVAAAQCGAHSERSIRGGAEGHC